MPAVLKALNRIRHRHGFGVHSPFAYRFITEVLCQPLHYYGYATTGRDPRLRLLLRLAAYFAPARVAVYSATPDKLMKAASCGNTAIEYTYDCPDMIVVDDLDTLPESYLPLIISGGTHALIVNASPTLRKRLTAALSKGMLFDNGRGTIVIAAFRHLPRQDFDVKF